MTHDSVAAAYNARAASYTASVGRVELWPAEDRELLLAWARGVEGPLLDVGCGPGHCTDLLRAEGADIVGIDPGSAFIGDARKRFPLTRFRIGRAELLEEQAASVGGVLAWFSLIHLPPEGLDVALREFARVVKPGGSVLIGFFLGGAAQPFAHPIAPAYYWSLDAMGDRLEAAGFSVRGWRVQGPEQQGAQALMVAERLHSAEEAGAPAPGGAIAVKLAQRFSHAEVHQGDTF